MGLILDDESSTSCVSKLSGPPLRFLRCSLVGMLACLPRHAWNSKSCAPTITTIKLLKWYKVRKEWIPRRGVPTDVGQREGKVSDLSQFEVTDYDARRHHTGNGEVAFLAAC